MPARRIQIAARRCGNVHRIAPLLLSGLLIGFAPGVPATAQPARAEQPAAGHSNAAYIAEASQRFGIPEHWISAILQAESAGNLRAVSSAGAMGLMQVMPDTWAELRARYGLGQDPFNPRDNMLAGSAYLREMWDRYGNIPAMLAAYNAGPGRYDEHLASGRALPAETRAYVVLLAPALGAALPSQGKLAASSPPPDWREAPLFVVHSGDSHPANYRANNEASRDRRSSVPAQRNAVAGSQAAPVFLRRDATGGRQ